MSKPQVEEFGWTAVPRNRSNMPSESSAKTTPVPVNFDSIWPKTNVVKQAQEHVKKILPTQTYNHSLRVYCYGHTLVSQHFPEWIAASKSDFFETWALTCLYHDIATTDEHRGDTHMSFEWHGGFMALQELQSFGAPRAQAESVCEAIIRHQDPGETGTISRMGQLVQIATEFGELLFVLLDGVRSLLANGQTDWECRQHGLAGTPRSRGRYQASCRAAPSLEMVRLFLEGYQGGDRGMFASKPIRLEGCR
jgi:cyanamide hydratase